MLNLILKKLIKYEPKSLLSRIEIARLARRLPYAKNNCLKIFTIAILSPIFFGGCGHVKPKDFSVFKEGTWEGKALIRDKQKGKSGIVNLKIKSVVDEKLRMDFTSPIGSHIASVLVIGDQVEYLNVADKALYKTKASPDSIKNILLLPLDPIAFYSILFDKPIASKNWTCVKDDKQFLSSCIDQKTGVSIDWLNREGEKRTVQIQHKTASVQINLYEFDNKVQAPEKSFTLIVPSSFKVKQI